MELSTPECDLESAVYRAVVTIESDISEALPYLNAVVEKGEYIAGIPVLVWTEDAHRYALRPHEIAISNISDRRQGTELVRAIVSRINATWEKRDEIEPSFESYERPKLLDILKLLPRTNCGECGLPSCMAFADALVKEKKELNDCAPVCGEDSAGKLDSLKKLGL